MHLAEIEDAAGGDCRESLLLKGYAVAGGHYATFNQYHTTFDPRNPGDFRYLIAVLIRKATSATATFLKEILEPISLVVDREIKLGQEPFWIATLVVTPRRSFERIVETEFEDGKVASYDLEFFQPLSRCSECFSLQHRATDCGLR